MSTPPQDPTELPHPSASRRILVVDDNTVVAMMLSRLLELGGYEVHTRYGGRAGLEAAGQLRPAAVLLDIGMPELDGYETCRLLRQQPWGQSMVIIAVTGYGQADDIRRSREAGFDEHLVKPVNPGQLLTTLTDLLVSKRPQPAA